MASRSTVGNTNPTADTKLKQQQAALDKQQVSLYTQYCNEPKVRVTGSPMYAPYFGRMMNLTINGIAIYVPMDGQSYEIPTTFADLFNSRIEAVDALNRNRTTMANIANNKESYAGELDLIHVV